MMTAGARRKRFAHCGVRIAAIVDSRPEVPRHLKAQCPDARIIAERAVSGDQGGPACCVRSPWRRAAARERIEADTLAMSGGWNPALGLTCHHGGRPVWNEDLAAFVPGQPPPGMTVAARRTAACRSRDCLAEGSEAGRTAARRHGLHDVGPRTAARRTTRHSPSRRSGTWAAGKAFVDLQNDVTADDIALADREGFRSVEHLKRYTTLGMATDQGKTLERQRPRDHGRAHRPGDPGGRHDELPAALRAGRHRRARRPSPRQAISADTADALASMGAGAGRGVRRDRPLAAGAIVPAPRRDGLARDRHARSARGALGGRLLRRLDARQDRGAGSGRRRFPRSPLHQHVLDPAGRTRALRR